MASPSTQSSRPATASESELSRLGGIEALKMKVGPVRRNLFGPVDHQQLQQDFQRLLCMGVEAANKRWNFDFDSETPREGPDMEWEELECQEVPAFFHSCMVRARPLRKRQTSCSSGEGSPGSSSSSSGSGDEYLELTARGCYSLKRLGKHKQPTITDFFQVKKRKLFNYKAASWQ